eukprot:CCRYP_005526-RA/>CCRYP_005526-RA protein AED:0.68 eAED:0.68 QI:0/0/0/0.66/1/1/3/0/78
MSRLGCSMAELLTIIHLEDGGRTKYAKDLDEFYRHSLARHGNSQNSVHRPSLAFHLAPLCCQQRFAEACKFLCLVSIK